MQTGREECGCTTDTPHRLTPLRRLISCRLLSLSLSQIFRNYRSHFDEQKDRMEARYRDLLESSVKDALKLSEENQKLRAQLDARLKQI